MVIKWCILKSDEEEQQPENQQNYPPSAESQFGFLANMRIISFNVLRKFMTRNEILGQESIEIETNRIVLRRTERSL